MSEEDRDKLEEELDEFNKTLSHESDGVTISQLIETLTKIKEKHGDLKVWYSSDYGWALPIKYLVYNL